MMLVCLRYATYKDNRDNGEDQNRLALASRILRRLFCVPRLQQTCLLLLQVHEPVKL